MAGTLYAVFASQSVRGFDTYRVQSDNPQVMHSPAHASWPSAFPRSFKKQYPRVVRGEKAWLYDEQGKQYLDLAGSAAVSFLGHGDTQVAGAMAAQLATVEFAHTSQFTTAVAEDCARELLDFAGSAFRGGAVYFTSGGSEAVETALKLARQYQVEIGHPERFQVISRRQSYHGATLGAMAVSGNARRRAQYLPMLREFPQINTPYCYRCAYGCAGCAAAYAGELQDAIANIAGEAAAFICEPVSGATLGAAVPPEGYFAQVRRICDAHELLWIADEVMTGCGRTGRNFAWEHWHAAPDILVAGKGLAAGYAPLGAVIASRQVVEALAGGSGSFVHGFTFNAHPTSVAAGLAVLGRIRELQLVAASDRSQPGSVAAEFTAALGALRECKSVGDVRGIGLLWGIEFVSDRQTKVPYDRARGFAERVFEAARRRGVLVYPMQGCVDGIRGDHVLLAPPAILSRQEIQQGISELRVAVREVEDVE